MSCSKFDIEFNYIYKFHIPGFKNILGLPNEHSFSRDGPINKVTSFYDMFHLLVESFCFI